MHQEYIFGMLCSGRCVMGWRGFADGSGGAKISR